MQTGRGGEGVVLVETGEDDHKKVRTDNGEVRMVP